MLDKLDITMHSGTLGCGIYEVGTSQTRMFVTDGGRVLPIEGRVITADDLMTVFVWGWQAAKESYGILDACLSTHEEGVSICPHPPDQSST